LILIFYVDAPKVRRKDPQNVHPDYCHISVNLINTILDDGHMLPNVIWILFNIDEKWVTQSLGNLNGKSQKIFWENYFQQAALNFMSVLIIAGEHKVKNIRYLFMIQCCLGMSFTDYIL
jgi:hypothetical protein